MPNSKNAHPKPAVYLTYKHLQGVLENLVDRLVKFSGLEPSLVKHFVDFTKCLIKPKVGTIDYEIFSAVLAKYFDILDQNFVRKMFERMAKKNPGWYLTVENFAKILCVFYTERLDLKIEYVFWIYDYNDDGSIDMTELSCYIKVSCRCVTDIDESDKDETFTDLVVLVSDVLSITQTGPMVLEVFREKVKKDSLLLYILGQIIPASQVRERFRESIEGKSNMEMREAFGQIRCELLYELPIEGEFKYYPMTLDLP